MVPFLDGHSILRVESTEFCQPFVALNCGSRIHRFRAGVSTLKRHARVVCHRRYGRCGRSGPASHTWPQYCRRNGRCLRWQKMKVDFVFFGSPGCYVFMCSVTVSQMVATCTVGTLYAPDVSDVNTFARRTSRKTRMPRPRQRIWACLSTNVPFRQPNCLYSSFWAGR